MNPEHAATTPLSFHPTISPSHAHTLIEHLQHATEINETAPVLSDAPFGRANGHDNDHDTV